MAEPISDADLYKGSLPEIPPQGPGPHFVVRDDGKVDFAPPEDIDRKGNNIARLRALHPTLRELAQTLCEELSLGNIPHSGLLKRAQNYRALIDQELESVPFERLYVEGVRLQNFVAATRQKIAEKELPSFEASVEETLESVLSLHGAFMLSTAIGIELIGVEERYKRRPEEEVELRGATLAFAEELKERPDIVEQNVADFVFESAQEIGVGPHVERSSIIGTATTKNVVTVIAGAAIVSALPIVGGAVVGAAGTVMGGVAVLVGFEVLKKSKSFQTIINQASTRLDQMTDVDLQQVLTSKARVFAPFSEFVSSAEKVFRRIGHFYQLPWLKASLDWLGVRKIPRLVPINSNRGFWKKLSPFDVSSSSAPGQIIIPKEFAPLFPPLGIVSATPSGAMQSETVVRVRFHGLGMIEVVPDARFIKYEPAAHHERPNIEHRFTFHRRNINPDGLQASDILVFEVLENDADGCWFNVYLVDQNHPQYADIRALSARTFGALYPTS